MRNPPGRANGGRSCASSTASTRAIATSTALARHSTRMFPISDDNPVRRPSVVTWALIAACVAAFLWQFSLGSDGEWAIFALGVIPASLFGYGQLPPELAVVPP